MLAAVLLSVGATAQSEYYALANQTAGEGTVVRNVSIQNTAQMAPQSCSMGSLGKSLPSMASRSSSRLVR